jgi:type I restriction enzyme M protein
MLTGEIRGQIDRIWDSFWSGGISNPLEVIEQITYLLFLERLDELETAEELKPNREKKPMQKRFFPEGKDKNKHSYQDFR